MKPSLLVIGHGTHGKDEFTKLLCQELPELTFTSSSWVFAEKMFDLFGGCSFYPSVEDCYLDRVNNREIWRDKISEYNLENPARLTAEILAVSNIYIGLRTLREYKAAEKLFDFIFYVDAMVRKQYIDSTFEVMYDKKTMILIDNNKDLEHLGHQAKIAAEIIKGKANLLCL